MTGNHDANLARKMKAVGLDPSLLRKQAEIWGIEWKFYPRYHKLQIDDYQVFHGDQGRGGKTPAIAKAEADWTSSAIGHHHTAGGVTWGCNNNSRYWGMSVGCGIDHKHAVMAYGASFAQKPIISCGVVIDGVPYFEPMPKREQVWTQAQVAFLAFSIALLTSCSAIIFFIAAGTSLNGGTKCSD